MSFSNPVTGGQGALVRPAIKSPNYVAGVSGWSINRDGSAEFNNLTLRGTFTGTNYVINASGEFFYSGAPAAGNLIASIANAAGTDAFGNAYTSGVTVYNQTQFQFARMSGGNVAVGVLTGTAGSAPDTANAGVLHGDSSGVTQLAGQLISGTTQSVFMQYVPGNTGLAPTTAGPHVDWAPTNSATTSILMRLMGAIVGGSGGTYATWQTPSYGAGFAGGSTASASYQALQYRIDAEDNLVMRGAFHFTANAPANPVFTLPAGFRPAALWNSVPLWYTTAGTDTYNGAFRLQITAGGAVNYAAVTAPVTNDNVYVHVTLPLGNIA